MLTDRQTDRQSNFELLRIFAMLFIVMYHYAIHGGFQFSNELTLNKLFLQMFGFGGKVGVNVFVIISGYFLVYEGFKLKKLLKLMAQMWFYSAGILLIVLAFDIGNPGFKNIIKSLLPLGMMNWFAYAYFVLYLIFTFENVLLKNLSHKKYLTMLAFGCMLWFVIPTFTKISMEFSNMVLFCYLYALGGYIRLYQEKTVFPKALKVTFYTYIFYVLASLMLDVLAVKYNYFVTRWSYFSGGRSIFPFVMAVGFFLYFKSKKIPYNKYINIAASTMFGVYLIHDNGLLAKFIWLKIFHNYAYYDSNFLVIHAVLTVLTVLIIGGIIDYLRLTFIEKPLFKYLNPKIDNLETKLRAKLDIILERIIRKTV